MAVNNWVLNEKKDGIKSMRSQQVVQDWTTVTALLNRREHAIEKAVRVLNCPNLSQAEKLPQAAALLMGI